jgi:hypothetical protein
MLQKLPAINNLNPVCGTVTEHQPIVEELIALLASRPDLADALKVSIRKAERPGIVTLPQYYEFLNRMVTLIPTDRYLKRVMLEFYYLTDLSPDEVL